MDSILDLPIGKYGFPRLWLFVLIIIGSLILGDLNSRMADARHLEQDANLLQEEVARLRERIAQLKLDIASANTPENIERWAHEDVKLGREGEHLVVLIPGAVQEQEVLTLPSSRENSSSSKIEIWLEFLFGK